MTPLEKTLHRRCVKTKDAGRRIVVSLEVDDIISLRLEGTRRKFRVPIADVYHMAVKREMGLTQKKRRAK